MTQCRLNLMWHMHGVNRFYKEDGKRADRNEQKVKEYTQTVNWSFLQSESLVPFRTGGAVRLCRAAWLPLRCHLHIDGRPKQTLLPLDFGTGNWWVEEARRDGKFYFHCLVIRHGVSMVYCCVWKPKRSVCYKVRLNFDYWATLNLNLAGEMLP